MKNYNMKKNLIRTALRFEVSRDDLRKIVARNVELCNGDSFGYIMERTFDDVHIQAAEMVYNETNIEANFVCKYCAMHLLHSDGSVLEVTNYNHLKTLVAESSL